MSGRIPQHFIDDVLARNDIVEIIGARIKLRRTGKNYSALCPFHHEKSPSFSVSPDKQFYHCFGCGVSGNAIGFLMEYERLDFVETIELLAKQVGLDVPHSNSGTQAQHNDHSQLYQLLSQAAYYYQQQLRKHPQCCTVIEYLKQRSLSKETIKRFNLGFAPPGWDNLLQYLGKNKALRQQLVTAGLVVHNEQGREYDRFRERLIFPIRDRRGRVIGFGGRVLNSDTPKYLNSPETPVFHKGTELYGLYQAQQIERHLEKVLIVEGYMDVIALAEHGINFAVATLGTATSTRHLERLFQQTKHVIFCFDGDNAGRSAAWRALQATLPTMRDGRQAAFLFLPEGEDPDSMVNKEGHDAFMQRIGQAQTLSDFLFLTLAQDTNLTSLDGRALAIQKALPLISQLPASVFRQMLIDKLAKLAQMEKEELERLLQNAPSIHPSSTLTNTPAPPISSATRQTQRTESFTKLSSPIRQLITLLLQQPQLATLIDPTTRQHLAKLRLSGSHFLHQLLELLSQNPHTTSGSLIEHWRGNAIAPHLSQLLTQPLSIPHEGLQAELLGIVKKLQKQAVEQEMDDLFYKASQTGLTLEEKQHLQALITEIKTSESSRVS